MFARLLSLLALAPAGDPGPWTSLPSDEGGSYAYRLLEPGPGDAGPRALFRLTPPDAREWATGEMIYEFDCGARAWTIVWLRTLDTEGAELRVIAVPEHQRRSEPLYSGDGALAKLYAAACPEGPPLVERPQHPPPIPVLPRR